MTRVDDAVTSGVPLPPGTPASTPWALFEGGAEVPLQSRFMPGVRTPWVLLDFRVGGPLAPGAARTFTLRSRPPAAGPSPALAIADLPDTITVVTGPLKVAIARSDYNLLDAVWFDANGDGRFDPSERVLAPTSASRLLLLDAAGAAFTGRGMPDSVVWEERGPLRATLRVDGCYRAGRDTLLLYTTRLTFRAGRADVQVRQLLRNSFPYDARFVKIKSALVRLDTASVPVRIARSGDGVWLNPANGEGGAELVPPRLLVPTATYPRRTVSVSVDADGGIVIPDLSYHGATLCLDFTPGLTARARADRAALAADRLVALAPDTTYSNDGAFGTDHFGTLTDEALTYRKWGWTWPTPTDDRSYPPAPPRPSHDYDPSWSVLDVPEDLEADDLEAHLIMYARTGLRSFLDRADAWARYASWEFAWRTDGFAYAGSDWAEHADTPGYRAVHRTLDLRPSPRYFTALDTAYDTIAVRFGKDESLHTWNGGLVDYYYLTGDPDALAAAADIAERSRRYLQWRTPGTEPNGSADGGARFHARSYLNFVRVWEATGGSDWRACADHARELFVRSARYDPRGFFYWTTSEMPNDASGMPPGARYPHGRYFAPFIMGAVVQALSRDQLLQPNDTLRTMLSQIAGFALAHGVDATGFTGDNIVVDADSTGSVRHIPNDVFRNKPPVGSQFRFSFPTSSESFMDALTIGYRMTGNQAFMLAAKAMWNAASKGFPGHRFATDTQVGRWVNGMEGSPRDALLYPDNGDLTTVQDFFHDAARMTWPSGSR